MYQFSRIGFFLLGKTAGEYLMTRSLMEHIPSFMTTYSNNKIKNQVLAFVYKSAIVAYIIYFILSPQALAQKAQAPDQGAAHTLAMAEPVSLLGEEVIEGFKFPEAVLGLNTDINTEESAIDERILKIEAYYARHNLPLGDYAQEFVEAADRYDIDWRLVAAIGFIESTGGKFACQTADYSPFGWGSCKIDFDSYEHAIDVVSKNLGGHNPNTAYFYKDKSLKEVLYAYNSVIPSYRQKILREMDKIESQQV